MTAVPIAARIQILSYDTAEMELRTGPEYSERLASFFTSLGHRALVSGPGLVELTLPTDEAVAARELAIYLRVWAVMYPDARVEVASS